MILVDYQADLGWYGKKSGYFPERPACSHGKGGCLAICGNSDIELSVAEMKGKI